MKVGGVGVSDTKITPEDCADFAARYLLGPWDWDNVLSFVEDLAERLMRAGAVAVAGAGCGCFGD